MEPAPGPGPGPGPSTAPPLGSTEEALPRQRHGVEGLAVFSVPAQAPSQVQVTLPRLADGPLVTAAPACSPGSGSHVRAPGLVLNPAPPSPSRRTDIMHAGCPVDGGTSATGGQVGPSVVAPKPPPIATILSCHTVTNPGPGPGPNGRRGGNQRNGAQGAAARLTVPPHGTLHVDAGGMLGEAVAGRGRGQALRDTTGWKPLQKPTSAAKFLASGPAVLEGGGQSSPQGRAAPNKGSTPPHPLDSVGSEGPSPNGRVALQDSGGTQGRATRSCWPWGLEPVVVEGNYHQHPFHPTSFAAGLVPMPWPHGSIPWAHGSSGLGASTSTAASVVGTGPTLTSNASPVGQAPDSQWPQWMMTNGSGSAPLYAGATHTLLQPGSLGGGMFDYGLGIDGGAGGGGGHSMRMGPHRHGRGFGGLSVGVGGSALTTQEGPTGALHQASLPWEYLRWMHSMPMAMAPTAYAGGGPTWVVLDPTTGGSSMMQPQLAAFGRGPVDPGRSPTMGYGGPGMQVAAPSGHQLATSVLQAVPPSALGPSTGKPRSKDRRASEGTGAPMTQRATGRAGPSLGLGPGPSLGPGAVGALGWGGDEGAGVCGAGSRSGGSGALTAPGRPQVPRARVHAPRATPVAVKGAGPDLPIEHSGPDAAPVGWPKRRRRGASPALASAPAAGAMAPVGAQAAAPASCPPGYRRGAASGGPPVGASGTASLEAPSRGRTKVRARVGGVFVCSFCPYTSKILAQVRVHERTHTGHKPYKCAFCNYRSAQGGNIRIHERRHTGERPYPCPLCSFAAVTSSATSSHMKSMHPDAPSSVRPPLLTRRQEDAGASGSSDDASASVAAACNSDDEDGIPDDGGSGADRHGGGAPKGLAAGAGDGCQ